MKPWYLFAGAGVALVLLGWGLNAERAQETPSPLVPYMLVVLPILLVWGSVLAIRRHRKKPELRLHRW